jgi:diamine N-acetyltransferase
VRPAFRGRGIGRALLSRLACECRERGWPRIEWAVLDWNRPAIDFYRSLGADIAEDWRLCRLDGEALAALAAGR